MSGTPGVGGAAAAGRTVLQPLAGLAARAPLHPSAAHARDLARAELARPEYATARPSWEQRALQELVHLLGQVTVPGGSPGRLVALLVVLLVVVGALAAAVRVSGRVPSRAHGVLAAAGGGPVSAEEHRAASRAAQARGDLSAATAERFRAVVRALQERDLLTTSPGLTAGEAARAAGAALPDCAERLRAAAATFDGVVYGRYRADAQDLQEVRSLDEEVARTRPAGAHPAGAHPIGAHWAGAR